MPATSIRCTNGTCRLRVVFDMPCQLSRRHIANAGSRNRLHAFQANAAIIFSNGEDTPCCRLGGAEPLIFCYTGSSTECCIEDGVSDMLFLSSNLSPFLRSPTLPTASSVHTDVAYHHWTSANRRRARVNSGSHTPCWTVGTWVSKS